MLRNVRDKQNMQATQSSIEMLQYATKNMEQLVMM